MQTMVEKYHEKFREFPDISPILLMRHTKHSFDFCVDLCQKILIMRKNEGIGKKKWASIR